MERLAALPTAAARRQWIAAEQLAITPALVQAMIDRSAKQLVEHQFTDAEGWSRMAIEYAAQLHDEQLEATSHLSLGNVLGQENQYEEAREATLFSLGIARKLGDGWLLSVTLSRLSSVDVRLGKEAEGLAAAREAVAVAATVHRPGVATRARLSLAIMLASRGEYRPALEEYFQALELNRAEGDRGNEAIVLGNIAAIYQDQGDMALAIRYYEQSIPIAQAVGFSITEARFSGNLAAAYLAAGKPRLAREYADRALALARKLNHRETIAGSLLTLGAAEWNEGRRKECLARYQQAVEILDEIGNKDILTGALPGFGIYLLLDGQTARAMEVLERARTVARAVADPLGLYRASATLGHALRQLKRPGEARAALLEGVAAVESLRTRVGGGAIAQQHFFADKLDAYQELVQLSVEGGNAAEAFLFAERGRMQALLEVLRGGHLPLDKALTAAERERAGTLHHELERLNQQAAGAPRDAALGARLTQARGDLEAFEQALYATHPELRAQRLEVQPASAAEARALLPDAGSALLEYVVTEDVTLLFTITREAGPRIYRIPIGAAALSAKVEGLATRIATRDLDFHGAARELYQLLLAPASEILKGRTTLILVPDGPLWRLPFPALETRGGKALLENSSVSYAPSATVLREILARPGQGAVRSVLAVGNPPGANLPGAEKSLAALAQLYGPAHGLLLTGAAATESAFKANAPHFDVLQIASHGVLDNDNPLYSYLSLAKDGANDGFLEARELAELDLHAQLVVLSACDSARGQFGGGEGLIGLTWALFLAGSPATIASGWKVDGETASRLMLELHRGLQRRESKAEALRAAALALRADPRYRHPFYWAAFSLSGSGR